jgi:hypothetical protein
MRPTKISDNTRISPLSLYTADTGSTLCYVREETEKHLKIEI